MPLSRDIRSNFHAIGKPHPRDFPERRVWFFGCGSAYHGANAAFKGRGETDRTIMNRIKTALERGRFRFPADYFSRFSD